MNKVMKKLLNTAIYLLIVLCAAWLLGRFVFQRVNVEGSSMESMLSDGDGLLVDKISYRFHEPERFDIIVFPFDRQAGRYFIKRIIGLPGETVQIDEKGNIYIDGEILQESYGREVILPEKVGIAGEPVVLGEDEYFVMGDNRNNSSDSRTGAVGNIKREDIIGRSWVRIWPIEKMGVLR